MGRSPGGAANERWQADIGRFVDRFSVATTARPPR